MDAKRWVFIDNVQLILDRNKIGLPCLSNEITEDYSGLKPKSKKKLQCTILSKKHKVITPRI